MVSRNQTVSIIGIIADKGDGGGGNNWSYKTCNAPVKMSPSTNQHPVFRLNALAKALSVIATATWLGGWLGGWLSHSGIVSKPLNLSENFFDHLKAPSL